MVMTKRILSGMRPTGLLHVGHLAGAIKNYVAYQDQYSCFFEVADWHALTTEYADPKGMKDHIHEMVIDWLSAGIDPDRSVIFVQSDVPEHAELHLLLSFITPTPWLERCPTYKEQQQEIADKDLNTYGFLGYPVLQAADILMYKANAVPIGNDQLPHLELTREIARRFNHLYGEVFPEPQPILSDFPRLPGIDNRKMSKSYNNSINLKDSIAVIEEKVKHMYTDPEKIRANDPGHPETCVVYAFQGVFNKEGLPEICHKCKEGSLGCVQDKKDLFDRMKPFFLEYHKKRAVWENDRDTVARILKEGAVRARETASQTLSQVKKAMKIIG